MVTFKTHVLQTGNNTGIEVPQELINELGGGKKPLVKVTVNGYTYRSSVGKINGKFLISLSAENRLKAGVAGGDLVNVIVELDTESRTVEIPEDLQAALAVNNKQAQFEKLAPSKQKAIVLSLADAKTVETRLKRIEKTIESLT